MQLMQGSVPFQKYDYGLLGNYNSYNSFSPPAYNLSRVRTKTVLFYGTQVRFEHITYTFSVKKKKKSAESE